MQSEDQKPGSKRKSLLLELYRNQSQGKSSPGKQSTGKDSKDISPSKKSNIARTPTSSQKEKDKSLYKSAYNAIVEQNLQAIEDVIIQLEIDSRNINEPIKQRSLDGKAFIHLVAETMDPNDTVLKYLVEQKGADVNLTDSLGNNALHLACRAGKLETLQWLESKGMDLLLPNKLGDYCAIFAAFSGSIELIKYLHLKKVNFYQRNQDGLNSLDIAQEKGHQEIVDFLLDNYENDS